MKEKELPEEEYYCAHSYLNDVYGEDSIYKVRQPGETSPLTDLTVEELREIAKECLEIILPPQPPENVIPIRKGKGHKVRL